MLYSQDALRDRYHQQKNRHWSLQDLNRRGVRNSTQEMAKMRK